MPNPFSEVTTMTETRVALITGASSGIGLALTKHLLSQGWSVVMADLQPPSQHEEAANDDEINLPLSLPLLSTKMDRKVLYFHTDVASFESQASTFQQAFNWHQRLDLAVLNAGITDRDDIFNSSSSSTTPPPRPDMSTFSVCLHAVYYGIKLFAHHAARNPTPGGRVIATASAAGLYPNPGIPQYTAAKHGVVGLVRALAPQAAKHNM
jgi:15-hydroxyprostaglandin dehydrogenase (NAD)